MDPDFAQGPVPLALAEALAVLLERAELGVLLQALLVLQVVLRAAALVVPELAAVASVQTAVQLHTLAACQKAAVCELL